MKKLKLIKNITVLIMIAALAMVLLPTGKKIDLIMSVAAIIVFLTFSVFEYFVLYRPIGRVEEIIENEKDVERSLREITPGRFPGVATDIINDLIQSVSASSIAEIYTKQIELAALQSQINPHFLYNTLDSIRGQALLDGNKEVAMMIKTLSSFFRYCISRKSDVVTFRDELDNIKNYMEIQRYRFGDRFSLDIDVDNPEAYDYYIPRLIFQPIVENSIVHGLESRLEGGVITIDVETAGDLIVMISDNGKGLTLEELDRLNDMIHASVTDKDRGKDENKSHIGIALPNIHNRIKLLYGDPYGIRVYSSIGYGTDVEIMLR